MGTSGVREGRLLSSLRSSRSPLFSRSAQSVPHAPFVAARTSLATLVRDEWNE